MNAIDYGTLAQEWLEHVVQQYDMTHVCSKDLRLIEHFLKEGFTLVAFRDDSKVLRVDFVANNNFRRRKRARAVPAADPKR